MIIGSIKEQDSAETRTALTPSVVQKLVRAGFTVRLEKGIGAKAGFSDEQYLAAGAETAYSPTEIYAQSRIILQILPPSAEYLKQLSAKQLLIADFRSFDLAAFTVSVKILQLERVPRVSKAQSIDILSTQNTVRGYMGAISALFHSPRLAPQLITAATSLKAASVLVVGAGVTGLQAAAVFKRQGCRVTIMDINSQNRELAKSVGAEFAVTPSQRQLAGLLSEKNFILAAATAPDGSSPHIITAANLAGLAEGAVVIDTTANNIEIETAPKHAPYRFYRNLFMERLAPLTASELWANNMANLVNIIKTPENALNLNIDYIQPMLYVPPLAPTSPRTSPEKPPHSATVRNPSSATPIQS